MKKLSLLFSILFIQLIFSQTKINGKIIDEHLHCLAGVKITNLHTGEETYSLQNGTFNIQASAGDTLKFEFPGLGSEKIKITENTRKIHLIMMNLDLNCIGQVLTDRQINKKLNNHQV